MNTFDYFCNFWLNDPYQLWYGQYHDLWINEVVLIECVKAEGYVGGNDCEPWLQSVIWQAVQKNQIVRKKVPVLVNDFRTISGPYKLRMGNFSAQVPVILHVPPSRVEP